MTFHHPLPLSVLLLVIAAVSAKAQTNIAVCDVDKVLSELDERRDGEAELKRDRGRFEDELKRRWDRLPSRDGLRPNDIWMSAEQLQKEITEIEIMSRVEEWRRNTKENGLIQRLDQKIGAACTRIAEQKKIDLVLIEHTPVVPADLTTLKPDQLRAMLNQKTIVYKSDKADITSAVIARLNADYAKSGGE